MLTTIRKIWPTLDRFDRVFIVGMDSLALCGGALLITRYHTLKDVLEIVPVMLVLLWYPWVTIPRELQRQKLISSICGDNSGTGKDFCVLEPGHPGDHKHFHSSGGAIGWPRKGGA